MRPLNFGGYLQKCGEKDLLLCPDNTRAWEHFSPPCLQSGVRLFQENAHIVLLVEGYPANIQRDCRG